MKTIIISCLLLLTTIGFANSSEQIKRVLNSGDGKSPDTAYEVYSTREEYQLLQYLEETPNKTTLVFLDNKLYDVFTVNGKLVWFTIIKKPGDIIIS